jgi:hypothetical protein
MVIPGSVAVLALRLFTMLSQELPFFADDEYRLHVSTLLFVSTVILVPTIFLPRGEVFDAALDDARAMGEVATELAARSTTPPSRSRGSTTRSWWP